MAQAARNHEPDPRFPSGPWTGFWLQRTYEDRQWMELELAFADGRLTGQGRDSVGPFIMEGSYDLESGRCTITKTYPGSHDVTYMGVNEGPRLWLWGVWSIRDLDHGGFHMWPEGEIDPTGPALAEELELPWEEEVETPAAC